MTWFPMMRYLKPAEDLLERQEDLVPAMVEMLNHMTPSVDYRRGILASQEFPMSTRVVQDESGATRLENDDEFRVRMRGETLESMARKLRDAATVAQKARDAAMALAAEARVAANQMNDREYEAQTARDELEKAIVLGCI